LFDRAPDELLDGDGEAAMTTSFPSAGLGGPGSAAPQVDRRAGLRFAISPETSCHLVAGVGETLWPARVLELSPAGIRLRLRRRFEPGTFVLLELANGARIFSCALVMRVTHATEEGDGAVALGGAFARKLTYQELMALLA
jgi:hypothetical protein